jgi:hypothetical protein
LREGADVQLVDNLAMQLDSLPVRILPFI